MLRQVVGWQFKWIDIGVPSLARGLELIYLVLMSVSREVKGAVLVGSTVGKQVESRRFAEVAHTTVLVHGELTCAVICRRPDSSRR